MFRLPVFNLRMSVWTGGHTPSADPADATDIPCQLYVLSKLATEMRPSFPDLYNPPIMIREQLGVYSPVVGDIFEVATGDADYYKARWVQVFHKGFPNAYIGVLVEQCQADGTTPRV